MADNDFLAGPPAEAPAQDVPRICFERILPPDLRERAAALALEENPDNRPRFATASPAEAVMVTGSRWAQNRTLRIKFLAGDPTVQRRVIGWANLWTNYINLKFQWVGPDEPADIRIDASYKPDDGSWSSIGTDALVVPAGEPTMRLGWLLPTSSEEDYSSVVLHEFGHGALALYHEHQSPAENINWDKPKVYQVFGGPPNNWDKQTIDENVFDKLAADQTQYTAMDPRSIMMYTIDRTLTLDGFSVGWNTALSPTDIQFASQQYPKAADPAPPPPPPPSPPPPPPPSLPPPPPVDPAAAATAIAVNARPAIATLAVSGGKDVFKVNIPQAGLYLISAVRVTGQSPYVVELHGHSYPNPNHVDKAGSLNFRLDPGVHYFAVRAFDGRSTGQCSVTVRRGR